MKKFILPIVAAAALLSGNGHAGAQSPGGASLVGRTKASPGCPSVGLHIIREGGSLSGVVFFVDGSGVSSVQGEAQGSTFNWHQTSIKGKGPTGDVTGTISPQGALNAKLSGTSCSYQTVIMAPNEYSN